MRLAAAVALALLAACGPRREGPSSLFVVPQVCANVVQPTVLPGDMVEDLGTLAVGQTATFTVGTGTSSFFIVSQEVGTSAAASVTVQTTRGTGSLPNAVVPTDLRAPDGTLYYDDMASWPTTTIAGVSYTDVTWVPAFDAGFQPAVGVLAFPLTSGGLERLRSTGAVAPGSWRFTVNDWAFRCPFTGCRDGNGSGRYRVQVVKRPGPVPAAGTLDLEVYLATAARSPVATAASAASDAQVARWKRSVGFFLGKAGIALGQVTFHDLPPAVKTRYAPNGQVNVTSSDPCGNLAQLFAQATVPRRAVHVFLADALEDSSSGGAFRVAGVDGSVPGPSGFPGTITGGAIVSLEDFGFEATPGACGGTGDPDLAACGTDDIAYVTAHEIGHWLGLFHPTEQDGESFDPIADTAPCPCAACAAASQQAACGSTTLVTNDRCLAGGPCGAGRNLMFWLLDDHRSTGELSPEQGQIMRLNPAVH